MGPIGWPETVFIFFLALILFGPKKLPELGRTVGKALADFQRAKGALTDAFDRETKQLVLDTNMGLDTEMLTGVANQYRFETSAIDASLYGSSYPGLEGAEPFVSSVGFTSATATGCDEPELQAVSPESAAIQDYVG
jgi:sec-independent protein translocase protein TatA